MTITAPQLLYDTRTWTGGDTLPNTGSAGNQYDMKVVTYATNGGLAQYAKKKSFDTNGNYGWTPVGDTTPTPYHWSELGGNPNTAGFTYVMASSVALPTGLGIPATYSPSAEVTLSLNSNGISSWRADMYRTPTRFDSFLSHSEYPVGFVPANPFTRDDVANIYNSIEYYTPGIDAPGTVYVFAYHPVTGQYTLWIDQVPFTAGAIVNNMNGGAVESPYNIVDLNFYLGENFPAVNSGKWKLGPYAAAMYRGFPTADDLLAIQLYFSDRTLPPLTKVNNLQDTFIQPQLTRYHHSFQSPMSSEKINLEMDQTRFDLAKLYKQIDTLTNTLAHDFGIIANGSDNTYSVAWDDKATPTPISAAVQSLESMSQALERMSKRLEVLEKHL